MSSVMTKITGAFSAARTNMYNYYHPLLRQGSITPFWHMIGAVVVVMYTTTYVSWERSHVQHEREMQKIALKEYYEKHGHADHH